MSTDSGRNARAVLSLLAHIVVILVLLGTFLGVKAQGIGTQAGISLSSGLLLVLSCWLIVSWLLSEGSLLNPYGLFLVGSMPFHVGFAFLRLMGQQSMVWLLDLTGAVQILETLAFVIACYAMLHLGALVALVAFRQPAIKTEFQWDVTRVYQVGWILLAISIIPMLVKIKANVDLVMSGGYSSLFESGARDTSSGVRAVLALMSEFYLPGVMFVLAGSRDRLAGKLGSLLGLALYSGSYLFMGFRAFSLIPIAVYVWLWHRCVRRLPIFAVVSTGFVSFLVIAPLIRRIRDLSGMDRMSFQVLWEAYTGADNPLLSLVAELAGSILTIPFTVELVPDVRPFEWGYGYLRALANAIPILHLPDPYGYSGSWLAWHVTPQLAIGGFGLGYSFMAEAYLNFSWVGGALMVGLIGLAMAGVQVWADRTNDPARLAFIASFLPIMIFFTRGESLSITRPILWYSLVPLLLVQLLRVLDRRLVGEDGAGPPKLRTDRPPVQPAAPHWGEPGAPHWGDAPAGVRPYSGVPAPEHGPVWGEGSGGVRPYSGSVPAPEHGPVWGQTSADSGPTTPQPGPRHD